MSRYCHVHGCRNGLGKCLSTTSSEKVSYHRVPKAEPRRTQWLNAFRLHASHKDLTSFHVCSDHFLPKDFCYDPKLSTELKFKIKKRQLNKDAVPSIFPAALVRPLRRPDNQARRQEQCRGRASQQPEQDVVPMPEKTTAVPGRSIAVQACPDLRSIGTQVNLPKGCGVEVGVGGHG